MENLFAVSAPGAPGAIQAYMEIKYESVNTGEDLPEGPGLIRLDVWENVPVFWYGRVDNWMPGGRSHVIVLPTLLCSFGKRLQSQDRL